VAQQIVSLKSWAGGSDRDYRIRGRHSRRFYQNADQLLRNEVELSRLLNGNGAPIDPVVVAELQGKITKAREGLRASGGEVEA